MSTGALTQEGQGNPSTAVESSFVPISGRPVLTPNQTGGRYYSMSVDSAPEGRSVCQLSMQPCLLSAKIELTLRDLLNDVHYKVISARWCDYRQEQVCPLPFLLLSRCHQRAQTCQAFL